MPKSSSAMTTPFSLSERSRLRHSRRRGRGKTVSVTSIFRRAAGESRRRRSQGEQAFGKAFAAEVGRGQVDIRDVAERRHLVREPGAGSGRAVCSIMRSLSAAPSAGSSNTGRISSALLTAPILPPRQRNSASNPTIREVRERDLGLEVRHHADRRSARRTRSPIPSSRGALVTSVHSSPPSRTA